MAEGGRRRTGQEKDRRRRKEEGRLSSGLKKEKEGWQWATDFMTCACLNIQAGEGRHVSLCSLTTNQAGGLVWLFMLLPSLLHVVRAAASRACSSSKLQTFLDRHISTLLLSGLKKRLAGS